MPIATCQFIVLKNVQDIVLEIPNDVALRNTKKPMKYLRFLGSVIVGVQDGNVQRFDKEDGRWTDVSLESTEGYMPDAVYRFVVNHDLPAGQEILRVAVNPAIARNPRTATLTELRSASFRDELMARDRGCVFTHAGIRVPGSEDDDSDDEDTIAHAAHIFPYTRADWLDVLPTTRGELFSHEKITDINDVRNGILLQSDIHTAFSKGFLVILKTPNHVLTMDDVPEAADTWRPSAEDQECWKIAYPAQVRYTLQLLTKGGFSHMHPLPNTDAAFASETSHMKLPSELMLHYMYAVSVVKRWGYKESSELLTQGRVLPVPPRLPRTSHDHGASASTREGICGASGANITQTSRPRRQGRLTREEAEQLVEAAWLQHPDVQVRLEREDSAWRSRIAEWQAGVDPSGQ
ncbi:hypothetical protein FB451DRAFT_1296971 [Mycena latifolia]|nr:hypothetical protein FB451DRAFT_1296971 [Mycena latifolia]